jgi:hypothetical protein
MQRNNLNHFVDDFQVIWDTEEKCQGGIDRLISSGGTLPTDHFIRRFDKARPLKPAYKFQAARGSAAQCVTSLPCQIAQAAGERLVTAQPARSEDVADVARKSGDLGFHQRGDRIHQTVEPASPVGLAEPVDANLQRVFGVVDIGQNFLGDEDPVIFEGKAQCRPPAALLLIADFRAKDAGHWLQHERPGAHWVKLTVALLSI